MCRLAFTENFQVEKRLLTNRRAQEVYIFFFQNKNLGRKSLQNRHFYLVDVHFEGSVGGGGGHLQGVLGLPPPVPHADIMQQVRSRPKPV